MLSRMRMIISPMRAVESSSASSSANTSLQMVYVRLLSLTLLSELTPTLLCCVFCSCSQYIHANCSRLFSSLSPMLASVRARVSLHIQPRVFSSRFRSRPFYSYSLLLLLLFLPAASAVFVTSRVHHTACHLFHCIIVTSHPVSPEQGLLNHSFTCSCFC